MSLVMIVWCIFVTGKKSSADDSDETSTEAMSGVVCSDKASTAFSDICAAVKDEPIDMYGVPIDDTDQSSSSEQGCYYNPVFYYAFCTMLTKTVLCCSPYPGM